MESGPGNVTIAALLATGATTLGIAVAGIVGVGERVRAVDEARQAPTPQQVERTIDTDAAPQPTTPSATTPSRPRVF